jgi:hypothetical protein
MISRRKELQSLGALLRRFPVVAITGARQVGKTTLAREFANRHSGPVFMLDMEDPADIARLADPMLALQNLRGLVIIDEVQRKPDLFTVLRVLVDRKNRGTKYLLLGSASPQLLQQSSESLAGRIAFHELGGFWLNEVGEKKLDSLWLRGGFPRSFLAPTLNSSADWRREFIRTFLERDIPQLGIAIRSSTLHRFWTMVAHYHGQLWNASEFARSFGISDTTVRRYLDLLTDTFVLRQLKPWSENLAKRQVKTPKVYVSDSGLLHSLLNVHSQIDVERHPKVGASWEGFVLEQIIRHVGARREECFFWRTYAGAELDLLIMRGRKRIGFEIKRTVAPTISPSMRNAITDLSLSTLHVVHAGQESFPMAKNIVAVSARRILKDLSPL